MSGPLVKGPTRNCLFGWLLLFFVVVCCCCCTGRDRCDLEHCGQHRGVCVGDQPRPLGHSPASHPITEVAGQDSGGPL